VSGGFVAATATPTKAQELVNVLFNKMVAFGYDGIDVDWEPLCNPINQAWCGADNTTQYTNFITLLRTKLNTRVPRPLLTAAIGGGTEGAALINSLQNQFDQINVMTYDLGGPWYNDNWMTWYNSAIYNNQTTLIDIWGNTNILPSADGTITGLTNYQPAAPGVKIPSTKVGMGIPFYGRYWSGGFNLICTVGPCLYDTPNNGAIWPRLAWTPSQGTPPSISQQYDYNTLMTTVNREKYTPQNFFWDYDTEASYLSIDDPDVTNNNDRLITFDDDAAVERKVRYAQSHNLGGVMIWELPAGHLPPSSTNTFATRQPLINSLKSALANAKSPQIVIYNNSISTTWSAVATSATLTTGFAVTRPAVGTLVAGTKAIKVVSSTLNGSLGLSQLPAGNTTHPARVENVSFAVYIPGTTPNNKVAVKLQNLTGSWFPTTNLSTTNTQAKLVPIIGYAGWYKVSISIKDLNPWGRLFNRVNFINLLPTGTSNTYYVGGVEFYGR
jgi:GH18 family chitinase